MISDLLVIIFKVHKCNAKMYLQDGRLKLDFEEEKFSKNILEAIKKNRKELINTLNLISFQELSYLYELYEERAGIIEYDGGLDRKQAEEKASEEIEEIIKREYLIDDKETRRKKIIEHELVQEVFKTFPSIKIDEIKFAGNNQINNKIRLIA